MTQATWENNGEPNDEGKYVAVVDLEDGSRPQRFIGESYKSVADQLLQAQTNATQLIRNQSARIRELDKPEEVTPPARLNPRPLSADERFQVAHDINDPTKAPEAIRAVIEAELGAPLDTIRTQINASAENEEARRAVEETEAFLSETPEFYASDHNKITLVRYMQNMNMAPTKKNFRIAFDQLTEARLLQSAPSTPPTPPPPPVGDSTTGTRPRPTTAMSTGIRSTDSSGVPDMRRPQPPKLTRMQIESMPEAEYRRRYQSEAGFKELVDKLYASQAQA